MSWIIFALLSAVFAALVAILGKVGLQNVDSTFATTIRAIVMALFLVIVSLSLQKFKLFDTFTPRALMFIALSGIAGALSWLCYFYALKNGPPAGVAGLDKLSVVFVFILSVIFFSQALTWKTGLGASMLLVGALLLV